MQTRSFTLGRDGRAAVLSLTDHGPRRCVVYVSHSSSRKAFEVAVVLRHHEHDDHIDPAMRQLFHVELPFGIVVVCHRPCSRFSQKALQALQTEVLAAATDAPTTDLAACAAYLKERLA